MYRKILSALLAANLCLTALNFYIIAKARHVVDEAIALRASVMPASFTTGGRAMIASTPDTTGTALIAAGTSTTGTLGTTSIVYISNAGAMNSSRIIAVDNNCIPRRAPPTELIASGIMAQAPQAS